MTEDEVAEAVAEWADLTLDNELAAVYPYVTTEKGALPDLMVEVANKRTVIEDGAFPFSALRQTMLRVFSVTLSFLIDAGEGSAHQQTQKLREFGASLEEALLADATLGDRVQMTSPLAEFDYSGPFVEYPDGTRGRQMIVNISVGELVSEVDGQ